MYLSKGNLKMKKGFLIWNLPAELTCIGSTELCRKHCYAKKAERQYKQTLPCRMNNLESSKNDDFIGNMVEAIVEASKKKGFRGFFRIHESGDFYSQKYLNDWFEICQCFFKDIKFLAFTKSFSLDFTGKPDNLEIVASIMEDTDFSIIEKYNISFSYAIAGDMKNFPELEAMECCGNCDTCGMCWSLSKMKMNVHFSMH